MNEEQKVTEYIRAALYEHDEDGDHIRSVNTFKEEHVMTLDEGLVINMCDGRKIHLTIQMQ